MYDADLYACNTWACWMVYSRRYLLALIKLLNLGLLDRTTVRSVADVGCGFGHTTAALKEIFPDARVFGTNLPDTAQFRIAEEQGKLHGFEMVPDVSRVDGDVDLVFASEYFEHIFRPIEHLAGILRKRPTIFMVASAFGTKSIGHFPSYAIGKQIVPGNLVGRKFNDFLRAHGYERLATPKSGFWNNRPAVYVLREPRA